MMRSAVALLLFWLVAAVCHAESANVEAERAETAHPIIPLRAALGDSAYEEAMASGRYVYTGNLKCRMCHKSFFQGRKNDAHDHALERIVQARDVNNGRCLACHTTGYGVQSGFSSFQETPRLMNVQCEGCHGPGSEHIRRLGKGGFLAGPDRPEILKRMCVSCHNARWSGSFTDFEEAYQSYKLAKPGE